MAKMPKKSVMSWREYHYVLTHPAEIPSLFQGAM